MRTADIVVAVIVGLSSFSLAAQDRVHSAENEQLGTVSFPISCMAESQRSFERGVALLHSFSAREARKQFETITQQDPRCSMAYWGVAMTYWPQFLNWPETDDMKSARQALLKAATPVTARERDYIDAIAVFYNPSEKLDFPERATAYSAAMERIYRKYPEDHEAAAFYGLSLLASESESDTAFVNREKAAKVLEKLFAEEPDHPGAAHYLIHIYDKPALAQRGLPAAR